MARNHESSSAGMGAAPVMAMSSWSRPSISRTPRNAPSSSAAQVASCSGVARPQAMSSTMGRATSTAPAKPWALRGVGAERSHDAGVHLLPHARHAEHDVGPHLTHVRGEQARVGTARDLVAQERLLVVAGHALGDVRHRQVRDEPLAQVVVELDAEAQALDGPCQVAVGQHHALGRTGGARGVDQRGQIVGRRQGRRRLEVEGLAVEQRRVGVDLRPGLAIGVVQDHQVLEQRQVVPNLREALEEARVLDDGDRGLAVTGEIGHLLG